MYIYLKKHKTKSVRKSRTKSIKENKMISKQEVEEFENKHKKVSKDLMFKSGIIGATIAATTVIIAPIIEEKALFFGILFGVTGFYLSYMVMVDKKRIMMLTDKKNETKDRDGANDEIK